MGLFFNKKKDKNAEPQQPANPLDNKEYPSGPIAGRFFKGVDRAASVQQPAVHAYVQKVEAKHAGKSVEEKQRVLDAHFKNLATGTGLGTGGLAAMPGIGTLLSLGGIAGESAVLLEACGLYALASAELHGVDISDPEKRRTIVLTVVSGASGNELVQALTQDGALGSIKSLRGLKNASGRDLKVVNSSLGRIAFKQMRRRFGGAMVAKILQFGLGAVLGAKANRKIADAMIQQVNSLMVAFKDSQAGSANK